MPAYSPFDGSCPGCGSYDVSCESAEAIYADHRLAEGPSWRTVGTDYHCATCGATGAEHNGELPEWSFGDVGPCEICTAVNSPKHRESGDYICTACVRKYDGALSGGVA